MAEENNQETAAAGEGDPPASLDEALGWTGAKLDEIGGASVGRVDGVYVDSESEAPVWLLVRMGRFGHHTLLPFELAAGAVGHVWAPLGRDVIRQAPRIEPGTPLTRERELELLEHFGVPDDSGRAAEVATRSANAETARAAAPPSQSDS